MKQYYIIHLPYLIEKDFVFYGDDMVSEGCRVLVNFNRKDQIGICGSVAGTPDPKIKYKPIIEVIDQVPVLRKTMFQLARWMAGYYHVSLGKALFAMLPSYLIPEVSNIVTLCENSGSACDPECSEIVSILKLEKQITILELRKRFPNKPVYSILERAEKNGTIELGRKINDRTKPRTVNYLKLERSPEEADACTPKQLSAFELLHKAGKPIPMSQVCEDISYSVIKALVKKGIISISPRKISSKTLFDFGASQPKQITLTEEQQTCIKALKSEAGKFSVNLVYGVTGSGKTEIYIELIKHYLAEGKGIIFLIPEIALTPQMVERFFSVFGGDIAILHSQLTDRERFEQWKQISEGRCHIALGARSAIFAPMPELGLIIVDEEHEQSYKQDQSPRYNARDMAILRSSIENAQVILGSATPSLESWHNVNIGKYQLQLILNRPVNIKLPEVEILDLKNEPEPELLSSHLLERISETIAEKKQVILFQNRRGYSSFFLCNKCGELIKCNNCEISMYYHRDREELNCHYCGCVLPVPRRCPKCGHYSFSHGAAGTQKIEAMLKLHFPSARILRLDSDSARSKDMYKLMYDRMKNREADILLGTQMISKGLDFPNVTLVGVVLADVSLNIPDFRAAERTFQLLTQVAGRSGRAETAGNVIIQTYNPDHYAIRYAQQQDFVSFAKEELTYRKRLNYPPYFRVARIVYQSRELSLLQRTMLELESIVNREIAKGDSLAILGPCPAPIPKTGGLWRYHLVIKALTVSIIQGSVTKICKSQRLPAGVSHHIDIDPASLL